MILAYPNSYLAFQSKEFTMTVVRIIASVIIPPVGVFLKRGLGFSFFLSIVLTILGYVPGLIYALFVVLGDE